MQVKDPVQENWFNKMYESRIKLSNNYTDLRPIISLIIFLRDWEDGLSYIKEIQQDLYDKKIIPLKIESITDYNKLQIYTGGQIKELLCYIWSAFQYSEDK